MLNIVDKTNGQNVEDYQYNSLKDNLQDAVESTGQTLVPDTGIADTNEQQASIAMAIHGAGGYFYIDSGTPNALILGVQTISGTPMRAPNVYFNGMACRFLSTNTNTGTATVNVASLGVKTIRKNNGASNLIAGDIVTGKMYDIVYSISTGFFELKPVASLGELSIPGVQGDMIRHTGTEWVRLPKGPAGELLHMNTGATAPEWYRGINLAGGILFTNQPVPITWTPLDFSSIIGARSALVFFEVLAIGGALHIGFRRTGSVTSVGSAAANTYGGGTQAAAIDGGNHTGFVCKTNNAGFMEVSRLGATGSNYTLSIESYIRL